MASVTVDVDIDEFDDAEVVIAAKDRGYRVVLTTAQKAQMEKWSSWCRKRIAEIDVEETAAPKDDLADILDCIREGRNSDAIILIEALMFPKFKTLSDCMEKYAAAKPKAHE